MNLSFHIHYFKLNLENMEDSQDLDPTPPMGGSNKRRIFVPIIVILVLVVGALMAIKASVQKEAKTNTQTVELNEGAQIPAIELETLKGEKVRFESLPHKVMMINFWATWCEACMEEMPSIVALREKFASKGFEVVSVNVDENPEKVVPDTLKNFNMKFPIYTDRNNSLAEIFDVHAIPLTVIVNHDRKILLVESGGRDWNADDVNQLMEKWTKE